MNEHYLIKNRTYTNPTPMKPDGICVHSTGAGYKNKYVLYANWNKPDAKISCHGMIDDTGSIQTLPLNVVGWHCGGNGNKHLVGFEICEPSNIAYKDAAHTKIDTKKYNPADPAIIKDFVHRYNAAVAFCADVVEATGVKIDAIKSHAEYHIEGEASNHADVGHWFPLFGKTMDDFRADVAALIEARKTRYVVQTGSFTNKKNAEKQVADLAAAGFKAIIREVKPNG